MLIVCGLHWVDIQVLLYRRDCACAGVGKLAGYTASSIALARAPFGEGVLPDASSSGRRPEAEAAVRLRERCKALLQIHMRHSSPREATVGSAAAVTDQRAMRCSRNATLHGVVQEVLKALSEHAAKVLSYLKRCYQSCMKGLIGACYMFLWRCCCFFNCTYRWVILDIAHGSICM